MGVTCALGALSARDVGSGANVAQTPGLDELTHWLQLVGRAVEVADPNGGGQRIILNVPQDCFDQGE
eukprot:12706347-Alexandrium_andersonii.AAC.1